MLTGKILLDFLIVHSFKGKISFNNLKRVCKELGENLTDEELQVRPPNKKPYSCWGISWVPNCLGKKINLTVWYDFVYYVKILGGGGVALAVIKSHC